MHKIGLFFLGFVLVLGACNHSYLLKKNYEIKNGAWAYADSLRFDFTVQDTNRLYNILLTVRHATDYSHQNLYTKIHTQFPDGSRLSKVLSLELADPSGKWQGTCNTKRCHLEIPIQEGAYFNKPGNYSIILEQFMRETPVKGIQHFTLSIKDTGQLRD